MNNSHQENMNRLRRDMRRALAEFRRFDEQWNEINSAFSEKIREENRRRRAAGRMPHTHLDVSRQKGDNLALVEAMSAATWWRDKAQALGTIILAEQALANLIEET